VSLSHCTVNQRVFFVSKQRELLPTVLMPGSITYGLCIFFSVLIFKKLGKLKTLIHIINTRTLDKSTQNPA